MTVNRDKLAADFPDIVRHCLRGMPASDHPDAGMLTAFVEGTLGKNDRNTVFDHLTVCSECNRLAALIAPAPNARGLESNRTRRGWFASAAARWVPLCAAAAVLICAAVVERFGQPARSPAAPPSVATGSIPATKQALPLTSNRAARPIESIPKPHKFSRLAPVGTQSASSQAGRLFVPESSPAVPGSILEPSAFETSLLTSPDSFLPDAERSVIEPQLAKAEKPPAGPDSLTVVPPSEAEPMWSLSDAGVLQKSTNRGQTWLPVAVPSPFALHDIAVLGEDIWVGGDRGTLYHSSDAGRSWVVVVPTSQGAPLSADIMRIVFSDVRHGQLASSDGQIWTTHDAGITWSHN